MFSNRGATLVHWILKEFRTDAGQPLDLVPAGAGADAIKPFALVVDDQAIERATERRRLPRHRRRRRPLGELVDATASPQTIVFEAAAADGFERQENVRRRADQLRRSRSARRCRWASQRLNPTIHWGPGLGDDIARAPPASFFSPSYNTPAQPIIYKDGSVERMPPDRRRRSQEGPFRYAGVDDHYFVAMVLNDQNTQTFRIDYAPVARAAAR